MMKSPAPPFPGVPNTGQCDVPYKSKYVPMAFFLNRINDLTCPLNCKYICKKTSIGR